MTRLAHVRRPRSDGFSAVINSAFDIQHSAFVRAILIVLDSVGVGELLEHAWDHSPFYREIYAATLALDINDRVKNPWGILHGGAKDKATLDAKAATAALKTMLPTGDHTTGDPAAMSQPDDQVTVHLAHAFDASRIAELFYPTAGQAALWPSRQRPPGPAT